VTGGDLDHRFVRLAALIRSELQQLERVMGEVDLALADFADSVPPRRELRGIGNMLHDFYTGAEHIFERISSELDGGVPRGSGWHRELPTAWRSNYRDCALPFSNSPRFEASKNSFVSDTCIEMCTDSSSNGAAYDRFCTGRERRGFRYTLT
jgi:hypothetical protein